MQQNIILADTALAGVKGKLLTPHLPSSRLRRSSNLSLRLLSCRPINSHHAAKGKSGDPQYLLVPVTQWRGIGQHLRQGTDTSLEERSWRLGVVPVAPSSPRSPATWLVVVGTGTLRDGRGQDTHLSRRASFPLCLETRRSSSGPSRAAEVPPAATAPCVESLVSSLPAAMTNAAGRVIALQTTPRGLRQQGRSQH